MSPPVVGWRGRRNVKRRHPARRAAVPENFSGSDRGMVILGLTTNHWLTIVRILEDETHYRIFLLTASAKSLCLATRQTPLILKNKDTRCTSIRNSFRHSEKTPQGITLIPLRAVFFYSFVNP
jgi:hypothetical protein